MMKQLFSLLIIFSFPQSSFSQSNDSLVQKQSYLFEQFVDGSVFLKSGETDEAPLNYNANDQTLLFRRDGKMYTLTGLSDVDSIHIGQKKFVPFKNVIYEVITNTGKVDLYMTYTSKINRMVTAADYNGTSKQSASQVNNTVTDVYLSRPYKGDYAVTIERHYWLRKGDALYRVNSIKQFLKPFSSQMALAIKQYAEANSINFSKEGDVVKLVNFCNGTP